VVRVQLQVEIPVNGTVINLSFGHCAASIVCVTDVEPTNAAEAVVTIWVKLHF